VDNILGVLSYGNQTLEVPVLHIVFLNDHPLDSEMLIAIGHMRTITLLIGHGCIQII
jgi:hypothetical protein